MHHKHFENLWDHLSLDMPHTLSPFKALCETNLCFRKQLILKNSLLFLENVSFPQSIHRTFTQPWVFSLILPPHRKATSFFVLLICFNQVAQWYKTQNKGRWVLLVYSGCVLEQFGFLLPPSQAGSLCVTYTATGPLVPSLHSLSQSNTWSQPGSQHPAFSALQGTWWCLRQTDTEPNFLLLVKIKIHIISIVLHYICNVFI